MAEQSATEARHDRGANRTRKGPVKALLQRLALVIERASWPGLLAWLFLLFMSGWFMLSSLEAEGSGFRSMSDYAWWFLVTVTTVGYGDLAPASGAGRAVAGIVMVLGVGTIGVVLGKLGEMVLNVGSKRRRGMAQYHERDHIVLFGFREGETPTVIEEIRADESWGERTIVLCSCDLEENPLPEEVRFVRGDLSSDDVLARACVAEAELVIIHRAEDMLTIVTALAVTSVNPDAHIVAHLLNPENEKHLLRVNPKIECVLSLAVPMLVQAMQDPGVTRLIRALVSNLDRDVLYRGRVPSDFAGCTFEDLLSGLKKKHEVVVVAVSAPGEKIQINPPGDSSVQAGDHFFYVGAKRLQGEGLQLL